MRKLLCKWTRRIGIQLHKGPGKVTLLIPLSQCLKMPENKVPKLFPGKLNQQMSSALVVSEQPSWTASIMLTVFKWFQIRPLESNH